MTDTQTDDETDKTASLMHESMKEIHSNILLLNIIYKTGRTTSETQTDFRINLVRLFRDEVIALTLKHVADMIYHETQKNSSSPVVILIALAKLSAYSKEELSESFDKFKHLYQHLREDHKTELINEAKRLNIDIEWEK